MTFTEHPRLLARIAAAFYVVIIAFALFAYLYVRGHLIDPGNMARTAANLVAHEQLYRLGFSAAVIVVVCNLPLGWILFELFKVVNPRLALLALAFITASATIEAVNLFNYITPLFTFTLPEYGAFNASRRQGLARGPIRLFGVGFSVSLTFFGTLHPLSRVGHARGGIIGRTVAPPRRRRRRDVAGARTTADRTGSTVKTRSSWSSCRRRHLSRGHAFTQ